MLLVNLLSDLVSIHCKFSIVCVLFTYRFKTGFYGFTYMPKEIQKAIDNTLQKMKGAFCFLDNILIVSKGSIEKHNKIVKNVFHNIDRDGFALKLSKFDFSVNKIS